SRISGGDVAALPRQRTPKHEGGGGSLGKETLQAAGEVLGGEEGQRAPPSPARPGPLFLPHGLGGGGAAPASGARASVRTRVGGRRRQRTVHLSHRRIGARAGSAARATRLR